MKHTGGNNYVLLDFFIYLPFLLILFVILWYFSSIIIKREGYDGGVGYGIDNVGISTRVSRSGTKDIPVVPHSLQS
jgi:hypothetical protein